MELSIRLIMSFSWAKIASWKGVTWTVSEYLNRWGICLGSSFWLNIRWNDFLSGFLEEFFLNEMSNLIALWEIMQQKEFEASLLFVKFLMNSKLPSLMAFPKSLKLHKRTNVWLISIELVCKDRAVFGFFKKRPAWVIVDTVFHLEFLVCCPSDFDSFLSSSLDPMDSLIS